MDNIHASSLKGYCSLPLCWRYLSDVSRQLAALHENGKTHGSVDLKHVTVEGRAFVLTDGGTPKASPASDMWQLAASAFELMLGTPILNGAGETSQTPRTPLPALPQTGAEPLNDLLHRCLQHNPAERPTAAEIHTLAQEAFEHYGEPKRAPRIHTSAQAQETLEKADRQWPERMMSGAARLTALLLLLLTGILTAPAQIPWKDATQEQTTQKMLDAALMLRRGDVQSWNKAQDELEKCISMITLMDELEDDDNDCPLVSGQMRTFGVNRIVSELKRGNRVQNTGRELLDGADARFSYSIYEKGVKKGKTATYTMSGRDGQQVFLIVPQNPKLPYSVVLSRQDGTVIPVGGKDARGVTYYQISTEDGPRPGETLTLKITNDDKENNASFIIINHNYRSISNSPK